MEEEKKDAVGTVEAAQEEKKDNVEKTDGDKKDSTHKQKKQRKRKRLNKKLIFALILVVIIVVSYSSYTHGKFDKILGKENVAKIDKALGRQTLTKEEAEAFINANLMQGGTGATVTEVTQENGLFKVKLTVSGQEYTTYITKDKQIFFPQGIVVSEIQKQKEEEQKTQEDQAKAEQEKQAQEMTKNDKPTVELFVMSHCPYGTQIEKGIIPVVKALGSKIDFDLKFCDYTMHGEKELKEELNQYCISQNQPDKLISYLECFLADENSSDKCMKQTGIDTTKLNSCVKSTDDKYKIMANFADQNTYKSGYPVFPVFQSDVDKYQVGGSPTLVINGTTISSSRDPQSLLKTVCNGFSNAPEECSQTLSSTAPSAGFGYGSSDSGSNNASCGQ